MLASLTKRWRLRAAIVLAAAYAMCLLAPTAVFAFSSVPGPAHCLTDDNHGLALVHDHQNGSTHHDDGGRADDHASQCCGLFCLSAISPDVAFAAEPQGVLAALLALPPAALTGLASDRIDRPPRSLLSS